MSRYKYTTLISDYKSRHFPYAARKDYRHYIDSLASSIAELKDDLITWKLPKNYFRFYNYVYLNPLKPGRFEYILPSGKVLVFKFEPFYVGKGTGTRAYKHLIEAENYEGDNYHKINTIRKIWAARLEPIIKIISTRESAFTSLAFEIDMIAGIGRRNKKTGPLTNKTDGGEGPSGVLYTKQRRREIGARSYGKIKTIEVRAKSAKWHTGRKRSSETCARIGAKSKGRIPVNRKAVQAEGKVYSSQTEAAKSLGLAVSTVGDRIRSSKHPTYFYVLWP